MIVITAQPEQPETSWTHPVTRTPSIVVILDNRLRTVIDLDLGRDGIAKPMRVVLDVVLGEAIVVLVVLRRWPRGPRSLIVVVGVWQQHRSRPS